MDNPSHVLVVFYSRCGTTERLALAAAVGAVQARANIRLRRLPDVRQVTECGEQVVRMKKEYVVPAEADILWADAIIFLLPPDLSTSSPECAAYLDLLRRLKNPVGGELVVRLDHAVQATSHGRGIAPALLS